MTVHQLSLVKRWQLLHRHHAPLESQLWDLMLTCWLLGWAGMPAVVLLAPTLLPACALLLLAPSLYVALRRRLHRRGALRCDWLPAAARASAD